MQTALGNSPASTVPSAGIPAYVDILYDAQRLPASVLQVWTSDEDFSGAGGMTFRFAAGQLMAGKRASRVAMFRMGKVIFFLAEVQGRWLDARDRECQVVRSS